MAIQTGKITVSSTPQVIKVEKTNNNIIFLSAKATNAAGVLIGNQSEVEANSAYELQAGFTLDFELGDLTKIYVKGTSSDVITYLINGSLN